jgi:1-acyl-sn-glycerol-3-phosphate acyltransferase
MAVLRSLLFAVIFYGWTVLAVLLSFPIGLFGTQAIRGWAHAWVRFHRWCARYILGISTCIEGVPPLGDAVVEVNPQSMN